MCVFLLYEDFWAPNVTFGFYTEYEQLYKFWVYTFFFIKIGFLALENLRIDVSYY